jgi:hypothetical protein
MTITKWLHQSEALVGQLHPQGANTGSNGKLKLMPKTISLPPAHLILGQAVYIRPAHFDLPCADRLTQPTASQAV